MMTGVFALLGLAGGAGTLFAAVPFVGPLLSFFGSKAGRWVAVGLVIAGAYAYGFYKGDAHGDKQCAAAALAAQQEKHELEMKAAADQVAREKSVSALLAAQAKNAEEKIRALEKLIADAERAAPGKPGPGALYDASCRATPAGVREHNR